MTFDQLAEANNIASNICRLKFVLSRCTSAISEGKDTLYVMGEELPIDISKHLIERASEMLKKN